MNANASVMNKNAMNERIETAGEGKGWTIAFWVGQAVLAAAFGMAGAMKTFVPIADLAAQMAWVADSSWLLVRFTGIAELAGAIGLILPAATRIMPILTPVAAVSLVVVSVLAAGTHVLYGDYPGMTPALVLGVISAFVAWGRFSKRKISKR